MPLLKKFFKTHGLFLLILWILPTIVYLKTMPHSLYFIDPGVTVASAYTLGIPTPPGYPSYMLLAHLFTKLPIGDVLFRVQLFTLVFSLAMLTLVYFFIQRLYSSSERSESRSSRQARTISLLACLMLAFSYTFWSQTLNAQSYIFTDLLLLTILFLLNLLEQNRHAELVSASPETLKQVQGDKKKKISVFKIGIISIILGAVAAGGSTVMVITVLPIVLFLFFRHYNKLGLNKVVILSFVAILAITLIYSYLPIRAKAHPFQNWGDPETLDRFFTHVQGLGLSFNDPISGKIVGFTASPLPMIKSILNYFYLFLRQFFPLAIPIGLWGAFVAYKQNKSVFYTFVSVMGMNAVLASFWISPNNDSWYILSYTLFTIFIGIGLYSAFSVISRRSRETPTRRFLTLLGMTIVTLLSIAFWYKGIDRHDMWAFKDYADNLYAPLPKNTVLFGIYDTFNAATLDRHEVRADRKDVFPIMTNELYVVQNYRDHLRHLRPDLVPKEIDDMTTFSNEHEYNDMLNYYIVWLLKKGYPVYVSHPVYSKNVFVGAQGGVFKEDPKKLKATPAGLSMRMELVEEPNQLSGLSSQLSDKSQPVVSPSVTDKQKTGKPETENRKPKTDNRIPTDEDFHFKFRNPNEYKHPFFFLEQGYRGVWQDLVTEYGVAYITYATWLLDQQPSSLARGSLETQFGGASPLMNMSSSGAYKKALEYFKKAQEIAPDSQEVLTRLAISYAGQGEFKKAQQLFKTISDKDPNNISLQFNLAKSYADSGSTEQARDLFNNIISNSTEQDQVHSPAQEQIKLLDLLEKKPQNYQPFENNDMNIKFYYPEGYAITYGSQNSIKLTNNNKGKDELTMLLYSKTLKDDEGIDDIGQLPFVIDGVLLQTQPGQFPGFASKMKLYSSGADTILLLELKKDRQAFAVRIFPGDSTKQQEFLNIVQSIKALN